MTYKEAKLNKNSLYGKIATEMTKEMDETKALNILSIMQKSYNGHKADVYKTYHQALQLAMDDMALVMNILAIYNDEEIHEDYLLVLDDVIKAFIEQRSAK